MLPSVNLSVFFLIKLIIIDNQAYAAISTILMTALLDLICFLHRTSPNSLQALRHAQLDLSYKGKNKLNKEITASTCFPHQIPTERHSNCCKILNIAYKYIGLTQDIKRLDQTKVCTTRVKSHIHFRCRY